MPLLIQQEDQISVDVWYKDEGSDLKLSAKAEDGMTKETFSFRKPSWGTLSKIMAESLVVLPSGNVTINPIVFSDLKVRLLLSSWTLKDKTGKTIPINGENMSKLHPDLWSFLGEKMDAHVVFTQPDIPQQFSEKLPVETPSKE